ncbi:hypothetical protein RJT34_00397 [Clitoria ternatea]|uniref:Uncharacterized protein n=1 Tax=Clitoria ternatea TaxID=43366 RepID=A0AAN9KFQ8_CLITE
MDLSYNSFLGTMPNNWKSWKDLEIINLWSNNLSDELPRDLSSLKKLAVLNLGKNEFLGTIPINLPQYLQELILRFNHFEGHHYEIWFDYLHRTIDLYVNNLSGEILSLLYELISWANFQSFDASSNIGNPELCGVPLRNFTTKEENGKHIDMDARNEEKRVILCWNGCWICSGLLGNLQFVTLH